MIISKTALVFLTFLIIFSVFVANVANLISVEIPTDNQRNVYQVHHHSQHNQNHTLISKDEDHLIWFLQISDIHISKFQDKARIVELKEFCDHTISIINPKVVLATGDLTDAKTKDHIGSRQFEEEWKLYHNVLNDCKVNSKTKWLDIRGNHDNFNVASMDSHENFFVNYSMQGKAHRRSYIHQVKDDGDLYSFIAVDATLDPGPRRPFNFVGILNDPEVTKIKKYADDAVAAGSKYIVWFGHFPTSCILTATPGGVRPFLGQYVESLVYLCGHLHQLGGLVKNMYTLQQSGFLELELGDWKDNRVFRLLAIDHGLLSFIDTKHGDWPLILITNPKHALYTIPNKEPSYAIRSSTHIRIIAFSISTIVNVSIKLDEMNWELCEHVKGPLYVAYWNPSLFSDGIHTIQVQVIDVHGRNKIIAQPFTLDNSRLSFNILARIFLMTNASSVFQFFFGAMVILCVVPLCILRYIHTLVKEKKIVKPRSKNTCSRRWLRKLWSLVTIDRIFYPLVIYPLYLCIGPWSAGYIIEDHFGVIFAWGIFVRDAYLPGSFTYAYGFIQLFMFQLPFTFILANCVDYRINYLIDRTNKMQKWYKWILFTSPFFIVLAVQVMFAYFFWLAYGTMAFLLGPLRTWSIIFALCLYWQSLKLPERCTREAVTVWYPKTKSDTTDDEQETDNIT